MAIGHAVQHGTLVYVYDQNGKQITSISAPGRWPDDGLKGFTATAIHVRKGALIYAYDETGHLANRYPIQYGNVENIPYPDTKRPQANTHEPIRRKQTRDTQCALSA
jgi:hypothetical protein